MAEPVRRGFPEALGAALGGVAAVSELGEGWTTVLVLAGIAAGVAIQAWWGWAEARASMWREYDLERKRRELQAKLDGEPGPPKLELMT
jgi:hypothetical protein